MTTSERLVGDPQMSREFDCPDCFARAEEAAENAMLGWEGVKDYYREFRANCPDGLAALGVADQTENKQG